MSTLAVSERRPLISVVLPVYNAVDYVEESVASILAQTCADFELLAIDDGSTDGSLAVLQRIAKSDSRVILISRENRGLVSTLNEGISVARGTWIARMDADDIALPNRFLRQIQQLDLAGADICGSWIRLFGGRAKHLIKHAETHDGIAAELLFGSPFAHPSVMMRASLAKTLQYDVAWDKCEDYDLWRRAFFAGWRMTNVPEVLLLYRQHSAQISTASSAQQQILTRKVRREYWSVVFSSYGVNEVAFHELLKLRDASGESVDMDKVDEAVNAMLTVTSGEARDVVVDQALRLYYRAAGLCPSVSSRWAGLSHSKSVSKFVLVELWVLSRLGIGPKSRFFSFLKSIYWWLKV